MKTEGVYKKNAQESYYKTNSSCLTGLVAKNKFGMSKNIYQQTQTVTNLVLLFLSINANAWPTVPCCRDKQIEATKILC